MVDGGAGAELRKAEKSYLVEEVSVARGRGVVLYRRFEHLQGGRVWAMPYSQLNAGN